MKYRYMTTAAPIFHPHIEDFTKGVPMTLPSPEEGELSDWDLVDQTVGDGYIFWIWRQTLLKSPRVSCPKFFASKYRCRRPHDHKGPCGLEQPEDES